jgi:hypothetical protein
MSISKRERILLVIVALLALFGAYYLLYLKPCLDEISALNSDNETKVLQVYANGQQITRARQLEEDIAGLDEQLALYGDSTAHSFDQPPVLVYLSDTISDCAADKNTIRFERTGQTGPIERYIVTISMVASYDELKRVIAAFEEAPYMLRISGLTVSTDAQVALIDLGGGTGTDGSTDTAGDTTGDTPTDADTTQDSETTLVDITSLKEIAVTMTLDFYCLSGEISEDTVYTFDGARQYGGDIFY